MQAKENQIVILENMDECCGCFACRNVCPKEAIAAIVDQEGFLYPHIDSEKCVGCERCVRACPINRSRA